MNKLVSYVGNTNVLKTIQIVDKTLKNRTPDLIKNEKDHMTKKKVPSMSYFS